LEYGTPPKVNGYKLKNTRLLNGQMPGPTIRVKAGDEMRILFKNKLQQQDTRVTTENKFSYPDSSNLHFHGSHVSGELPSDDVTYKVDPGDEYQYETHYPENHMPGTHWLHPHVHGSGALQVRLPFL
jgi:FtsP/CotA-like multicopper oxidase with cupredoxin domain